VESISLCFQLRWPEASFSVATDGRGGLEALQSESFDIVILDINLPDITGFEVLSQIRLFSSVPVIIVTVRSKEEDRARGLKLGANDYVIKPFKPRDLIDRIEAVLNSTQASEISKEQQST
jgi:DNA-binding response OmpR family regulator